VGRNDPLNGDGAMLKHEAKWSWEAKMGMVNAIIFFIVLDR